VLQPFSENDFILSPPLTLHIEEKISDEMKKIGNDLANKEDITPAKGEIINLKKEIALFKADLIKWMFFFWVAQVGSTFGFILLFLKK